MDTGLRKALMSFYKPEMIKWLKENPSSFDEAVKLALSDEQPYSWRAAWLLYDVVEPNDKRLKPQLKNLIKNLPKCGDGHKRELLKIIDKFDWTDTQEGMLFDQCLNIWEQIHAQPSVRYTAFKIILKITERHPDLKNEIPPLIQDHFLETFSPGVKHSLRKLLKKRSIVF